MFYFPFFSGGRQSNRSSANSMPVEGLPLAELLPAAEIDQVFAETGADFGQTGRTIFTPAITLWAFLGQVLGENKSCCQAVLRVMVLLAALGRRPCAADTAAYCRARAKLPVAAIRLLGESQCFFLVLCHNSFSFITFSFSISVLIHVLFYAPKRDGKGDGIGNQE